MGRRRHGGGVVNHFEAVVAAIIFVVGTARAVRLFLFDSYPPVAYLRAWWDGRVRGGWNPLMHCPYCAAPYLTLALGSLSLWALHVSVPFSHLATWFWLLGGWGAASYAVAMVVAYDGDEA